MTARSTVIGDRRQVARQRAAARRRHPTQREQVRPVGPPPVAFYVIAVVVAVFTMLGLLMVLSATSVREFHRGNSPWRVFGRQAGWAFFGIWAIWLALRVPMYRWRRLLGPLTIASYSLMVLPWLPGLGTSVNGARAWVSVGSMTFQPSEFLKLALLLQCANLLAGRRGTTDVREVLGPVAWLGIVATGLCVVQNDLGSAIVVASIAFTVVFMAGAPLIPMAAAASVLGVAGSWFVLSTPYRRGRFTAFLDIAAHKDHLSYQTWQAMIAVAEGGLSGSGVGRGDTKLGEFLPLAHSDFIFAVVAEELGMLGVVAVIGGFFALVFAAVQIALAAHDRFHAMVAGGIAGWFAVQTTINIGGVVGLLPVTGLTLPFFSVGGSSLLVSMAAAGLLLNVARNVR